MTKLVITPLYNLKNGIGTVPGTALHMPGTRQYTEANKTRVSDTHGSALI
jgi:hypothetical protein